ncbi:MAG: IMP cyclohydrolase [Candidatus Andersenbacteria bacterium]
MTDQNETLAQANLTALSRNPYPGRGIVVGLDETSDFMVQIYWIMGRSENSRNRVFKVDMMGRLYTEAADEAKMSNPSLVIYNAMREVGLYFIVSNGDQTDTVAESWSLDLNQALRGRIYEPDAPNFTPRITALSSLRKHFQLSILRKSRFGDGCDRLLYECAPYPGFGYCITTYAGDGDPLPSFCGDPLVMPLRGGPEDILDTYWSALNEANRVSLAVKFIERKSGRSYTHIANKYTQKG